MNSVRKTVIRRLRGEMSQQEMAERLGVDQATISRFETGKQTPSKPVLKLLEQIANAKAK